MPDGRRVLITGVAGGLAAALARRLDADERVDAVFGVDFGTPAEDLASTKFVRAELTSPAIGALFERERIDTLVHLAISATPPPGIGDRKEHNVIGTMQLLAAAQRATRLRTVVCKSSTAVYGSEADNQALFAEDVQTHADHGYARDVIQAEEYTRAFSRRRDDVVVTILRFTNLLGSGIDTPFGRYLAMSVIPTVLGYDPRLQLCHTDDAVEVLHRACAGRHPGIYNVAAPGVLYLSQAARIAGRPTLPVPVPLVDAVARSIKQAKLIDVSTDQLRYLSYGRVADISRLRDRFGYEPQYSARQTLQAFIDEEGIERVVSEETLRSLERGALRLTRRLIGAVQGGGGQ